MNGLAYYLPYLAAYESNTWLTPAFIGAVAIIALFGIMGLKRGLIRTVFELAGMLIGVILTVLISPYMASMLRNSASVYDAIHSKIEEHVHINFNSSGDELTDYLDGLNMPNKVDEFLLEKSGNVSDLANSTVEQINRSIVDKLTDMAINCISFVVTFIIIMLLLTIAVMLLDLISKLPVLNFTNKLLGLAAGLIEAYLILSVIGVMIMIFSTSKLGIALSTQISSNPILSFIYKHNLILMGITKVRGFLK